MRKIAKILFYVFLLLLVVLTYNTLTFKSKQVKVDVVEPIQIGQGFEKRLQEAIRIPSVSRKSSIDTAAFVALNTFLDTQFPLADSLLEKKMINEYSRLYLWPGRNRLLKPLLLMAHLDVVPIEEEALEKWTVPPFSGALKDGFIWGRGSMDDKMNVIGVLEAAERLLKEGYQPERSIYFAFGHDEEVSGQNGGKAIVEYLKSQGVQLEFVLDEGLAIVDGVMPGIEPEVAMIGLAEKGYLTLEFSVEQEGGHSSMPPKQTAIGVLSAAIAKLEANPLPAAIDGPTRELFEYTGPEMPFHLRIIMANLWLFEGVLNYVLSQKTSTNAAIRTTMAFTMIDGGVQENVLPTKAAARANFRLRPGDTAEGVTQQVKDIIDDSRITVYPFDNWGEPSKVSSSQAFGFQIVQRSIKEVFPEVIVAPALVMATTDSRFYDSIADNVYRFFPIILQDRDMERIHGIDERIAVDNYRKAIAFYYRLMRNASS